MGCGEEEGKVGEDGTELEEGRARAGQQEDHLPTEGRSAQFHCLCLAEVNECLEEAIDRAASQEGGLPQEYFTAEYNKQETNDPESKVAAHSARTGSKEEKMAEQRGDPGGSDKEAYHAGCHGTHEAALQEPEGKSEEQEQAAKKIAIQLKANELTVKRKSIHGSAVGLLGAASKQEVEMKKLRQALIKNSAESGKKKIIVEKKKKAWKKKDLLESARIKKLRTDDEQAIKKLQAKSGELAVKKKHAFGSAEGLLHAASKQEVEVKSLRGTMLKSTSELAQKKQALSEEVQSCVASGLKKRNPSASDQSTWVKRAIERAVKQVETLSTEKLQKKLPKLQKQLNKHEADLATSLKKADKLKKKKKK